MGAGARDASSNWELRTYLVLSLVDGTDLGALLRRGRLRDAEAAGIVAEVAAALDAAHARGLIHRDVKPSNVLLSGETGRAHAYLTDFGISELISSGGELGAQGGQTEERLTRATR